MLLCRRASATSTRCGSVHLAAVQLSLPVRPSFHMPQRGNSRGFSHIILQGDDVEILVITKEGVRTDRLELKRD